MSKFAVIISVCPTDNSNWFEQALQSIINQTESPSEIVITVDGNVPASIVKIIKKYETIENTDILIVKCKDNLGRGPILSKAIEKSNCELIAIMDADDISVPNRFELQLERFRLDSSLDVIGGWIQEIDPQTDDNYALRVVPEKHAEIVSFSKWRNPINQMTVMFRKSAALAAGNYQHHIFFEDMWLWARMMKNESTFYNLQSVLVYARAGQLMILRRRGLSYLKSEVHLFWRMYQIKAINFPQLILNVMVRSPLRLLPSCVLFFIFKSFLRSKK